LGAPAAEAPPTKLAPPLPLQLTAAGIHDAELSTPAPKIWEIRTTGTAPFIFTAPLAAPAEPERNGVLSFEYVCVSGLDGFAVGFGPPWDESRRIRTAGLAPSEGWITFALDLGRHTNAWLPDGKTLRLDLGPAAGRVLQIRNAQLRPSTERERQLAGRREAQRDTEVQLDRELHTYLKRDFPCHVARVAVRSNAVEITGSRGPNPGALFLVESPLWQPVRAQNTFERAVELPASGTHFTLAVDRYVPVGQARYDRLFSRWGVARQTASGFELLSHLRYADEIPARWDLPDEQPRGKKGLGGFGVGRAPLSDLDDLGISSVTVNVCLNQFIRAQPSAGTLSHEFDGRIYPMNRHAVESLDKTLQAAAARNLIVLAIILVNKADGWDSPELGRVFQHPDCDPAGIYSMANVTSAEGIEHYAAVLDFLAQRYSQPAKPFGRIHHWIIHNEVDAGWEWTNCGEKPPLLFLDQYHKSMRTVYCVARKYNPHAQVLISLTHYWNWTCDTHFYHSRQLLEDLIRFSQAEGDFDWAIAQHPYPQSLFEPKSWLDKQVDNTFDTPLITFKNIEVLDAWVRQPRTFYLGRQQRDIHLSEQGPNSRDYSAQALAEQAAGMAYAWKKIAPLASIRGFQYHNWVDNRAEGGLRIGLRRFPDDAEDPLGRKPVWAVFAAAGTPKEDAAFAFAKPIIGLHDWQELWPPKAATNAAPTPQALNPPR
jgi:hypothetical protein